MTGRGEFASCQTLADVFVACGATLGLQHVAELAEKCELYRERLREIADEVAAVGLVELAQVLRQAARRAKPTPWKRTIAERYAEWKAAGG
jgi:hypothetical protein